MIICVTLLFSQAVVYDRATGHMLTGNKAPSAANLDQWLKDHPTFEAVRSGGKVVTAKVRHHLPYSLIVLTINGSV